MPDKKGCKVRVLFLISFENILKLVNCFWKTIGTPGAHLLVNHKDTRLLRGLAMVFDKFWVHDAIAIDLYDVICRSSRNGFIEDFRLSETVIFLPKMFNRNLAGF
jgi:hypothetical protein